MSTASGTPCVLMGKLSAERGFEDAACVRLTGIYHNLIRYWADA